MNENTLLRNLSLLSVIFLSVHITGDIMYGFEKGDASNLLALPIMAIWSYVILFHGERKWGFIFIILVSLLGLLVPVVHMKGAGLGSRVSDSLGWFLFIWTTIALGVTSILTLVLSIRGLLKRG